MESTSRRPIVNKQGEITHFMGLQEDINSREEGTTIYISFEQEQLKGSASKVSEYIGLDK